MATTAKGSGRRKVTQADVAKHAGVSPAIVSAVLNNRQYGNIRISDRTRQRVLDAVRELDYSPNLAARNLAGGSNRLIGVFSWQRLFPLVQEDFFYEFLVGVEEASEQAGYNLLMLTASKNAAGERSVFPGGANGLQLADGGILLGWGEKHDEIRRLDTERYPFVFIGERDIADVPMSFVAADYRGAVAGIVDRLAGLGHRRIGMVEDTGAEEPVPGRRAGFAEGAARNGIDPAVAALGDGPTGSERLEGPGAAVDWMTERGLTALVVEKSLDAVAIREAAAGRALAAPRDYSLVGLSGTPELPGVAEISELSIPRREMGRKSVDLLVQLLADPDAAPVRARLECGLREAETIGAAR